jgi:hypothetical protein
VRENEVAVASVGIKRKDLEGDIFACKLALNKKEGLEGPKVSIRLYVKCKVEHFRR